MTRASTTLGAQAFAALAIGCAPASEVATSELRPTVLDAGTCPLDSLQASSFALWRRRR